MAKEQDQNWGKVIAKAWSDETFKEKLIKNPVATLKEFGIDLPKGVSIHVHENSGNTRHLVIPTKPEGDLSEEKLQAIAGGLGTKALTCSYCV